MVPLYLLEDSEESRNVRTVKKQPVVPHFFLNTKNIFYKDHIEKCANHNLQTVRRHPQMLLGIQ